MKIVKQMEFRLYEMEGVNKVLCRIESEFSINENVLFQNIGSSYCIDFMCIYIFMVYVQVQEFSFNNIYEEYV